MRRCLILLGLTGIVTAIFSLREVLCIAGGNEIISRPLSPRCCSPCWRGRRWKASGTGGVRASRHWPCCSPVRLHGAGDGAAHTRNSFFELNEFPPRVARIACAGMRRSTIHNHRGAARFVMPYPRTERRDVHRQYAAIHRNWLRFGRLGIFLLPNVSALRLALAVAAFDSVAAFVILRHP